MPRHTAYECDRSGERTQSTEMDTEEPWELPPGWTEITMRRAVPNPDYAEELTELTIAFTQAAQADGREPTPEQVQGAVEATATSPQFVVDEVIAYLAPAYAPDLSKLLNLEE